MRKVAAGLGVTAPALYRHFSGKADLLEALLEDARKTFLAYVLRSLEGDSPWERLQGAQAAYLDFALERREAYELLMLTPNQFGMFGVPASLERWTREPPAAFQVCIDRVAECMRSGDLVPGDPSDVALTLTGLAHGLVTQYLAGRFGEDEQSFRHLYDTCFQNLYRGLRPGGGA